MSKTNAETAESERDESLREKRLEARIDDQSPEGRPADTSWSLARVDRLLWSIGVAGLLIALGLGLVISPVLGWAMAAMTILMVATNPAVWGIRSRARERDEIAAALDAEHHEQPREAQRGRRDAHQRPTRPASASASNS